MKKAHKARKGRHRPQAPCQQPYSPHVVSGTGSRPYTAHHSSYQSVLLLGPGSAQVLVVICSWPCSLNVCQALLNSQYNSPGHTTDYMHSSAATHMWTVQSSDRMYLVQHGEQVHGTTEGLQASLLIHKGRLSKQAVPEWSQHVTGGQASQTASV